jgi:hypothetical protein
VYLQDKGRRLLLRHIIVFDFGVFVPLDTIPFSVATSFYMSRTLLLRYYCRYPGCRYQLMMVNDYVPIQFKTLVGLALYVPSTVLLNLNEGQSSLWVQSEMTKASGIIRGYMPVATELVNNSCVDEII